MKLALLLFLFAEHAPPPAQPIAYSHKLHAGALGLACKTCHTNPDPGELMGFPATSVCMTCHQTVKKDSPQIQKLAAFHEQKQPVPWKRVYQIPSFVFFSHKTHLESGAACETCHGPVKERDALWREKILSMGNCMECHQKTHALNDCDTCHEPR
ncbi:MAG: cytochrome c3 family protein [Bryobacterales bacterium]|nr:cytochrome c3 family protein [Bryobacterales bacterium]